MSNNKLKGTQTQKLLMQSFANEAMARNRYTYYSKVAKKEGYVQISNIFLETAENELVHAKQFFKYLGEDECHFDACGMKFPVGIGTTEKNLKIAADGEHEENTLIYPGASKIAQQEGFSDISDTFAQIAIVEGVHEARYKDLLGNLMADMVFKKDFETTWKCLKCGHHIKGKSAPNKCPACHHPQEYFQMYCKSF